MNRNQLKTTAVAITLILTGGLVVLTNYFFIENRLIPLCIIPVIIGFLPPIIAGGKHPMHHKESAELSFVTLGLAFLILIIFPLEHIKFITNFYSLIMATPIVWLFSYSAFRINDRRIFKVKDFFR